MRYIESMKKLIVIVPERAEEVQSVTILKQYKGYCAEARVLDGSLFLKTGANAFGSTIPLVFENLMNKLREVDEE